MIKLLLCLLILVGCSVPENDINSSFQPEINWDELSYDWVTDKGYHNALGTDPYAISGYYPLTFFTEGDLFSFTYNNEYYAETYTITGHWLSDTIHYEFSPIPITYHLSGKKKTSALNLKANITQGQIQSECTLVTEDGIIYPIALDLKTGDLIDNDSASFTYKQTMKFTDQLWVMCYSYMKNFYERMLRDEILIHLMQQDMSSILAEESISDQDMLEFDVPRVSFPNSGKFWDHLKFAHFDHASFKWKDKEYSPWNSLEEENPQLLEISSSIQFDPVQDIIKVDEEDKCMTIFYMNDSVILDSLPMLHVYKTDQGYLIDGEFGQASFQSDLFTELLQDYFDDEKADKEFLSQISESDIVKAYLSVHQGIEKTIVTDDVHWIFQQIQALSNSFEFDYITPESISEINVSFIFKKGNQVSSFCLHSTGDDSAWIRYEGKFTEFRCESVLQEIISKVKTSQ